MKHYKRDWAILIGMFVTLFAMVIIIAYIAVNDGIPAIEYIKNIK